MTAFKWLTTLVFAFPALAATIVPTLRAESPCPGNVASLRFRLINGSRIIVPVEINHTGPYDFLLDTGAQITVVDPSMAEELDLKIPGAARFAGVGFHTSTSVGRINLLAVGSKSVADNLVVVQDLAGFKTVGLNIRGILGGNFLGNFDVFIDYAHSTLCLDDAKQMQARVKGEHIALADLPRADGPRSYNMPLIIAVKVLRVGMRPLLLKLDSGSNVMFVFDPESCLDLGLFKGPSMHGKGADGVQRGYSALPPQDLKIGTRTLQQIPLVRLANSGIDVPAGEVDGLLPASLFRSMYISYADRYVVLEPR
jgi:predicted aspartyl protease